MWEEVGVFPWVVAATGQSRSHQTHPRRCRSRQLPTCCMSLPTVCSKEMQCTWWRWSGDEAKMHMVEMERRWTWYPRQSGHMRTHEHT